MDSALTHSTPETVSANLRMILRGLLAALGAWPVEPMIALLLYRRVSGAIGRIERMLARFRAGRLWQLSPHAMTVERQARRVCAVRLPRRFGWLVRVGGHQAACFGLQLHSVLNTPDMAEMLAASAQARRVLQPLCRALAMELPWMVGTTARARGETTPRRRRPRTAPVAFKIRLPRGVMVAARREGFGKDR